MKTIGNQKTLIPLAIAFCTMFMMALFTLPVQAQNNETAVSGTVTDANTGEALPAVNIGVKGTTTGTSTNTEGAYELTVSSLSDTLVFSFIGYQAQTVPINGRTNINVDLQTQTIKGDEVVVTGTAGDRRTRTLGNSISQVDVVDKVDKIATSSVTDILQASSPGVNLSPGSGTAGSSPNITLRGANSINAGNRPVIYIDGVRIHDGSMGNFNVFGQNTTGLDAINPNDIKSIEIIKGPAAATLYGAEASAGVIQIITKRGSQGEQNLQWNAGVDVGQVKWTENLRPTNYAVATEERINDPNSWPGFEGKQAGDIISHKLLSENPDALRNGLLSKYFLSTGGGGNNYSFYISGSRSMEEGVFNPNSSEKNSLRANFSTNLFDNLDLSVNTSYANNDIQLPLNDNHAQSLILSSWLATPGRQYSSPAGYQYLTISPQNYNTYDNGVFSNRYILGATANFTPASWFDNTFRVGYDFMASKAENYYAPGGPFDSRASFGLDNSNGLLARGRTETQELTLEYSGTVTYDFSDDLRSNLSFGAQYLSSSNSRIEAIGQDLGSAGVRSIGSAAVTRSDETFVEQKSFGIYVQEQLALKDRLFLTGAVRMDNNSAFGSDINRTFYPKASVSYVISDESFFDKYAFVDYLKLRTAWGQSGNAPGPFDAARTYGTTATTLADGTSISALIYDSFGNPDLKPERSSEVEIGFDATLYDERMEIQFTYYNTQTKDALIAVPVAPSTGFAGSQLQNLGEIADRGVELSVGLTPLRTNNFTINSNINFTYNKNELISFGSEERESIRFGVYAPVQRFEEGKPLGAFWANAVQYNDNGNVVTDENGRPVLQDEQLYKGPATPPYKVGFSSTVDFFKNFQLYFLLDYQAGHYQFNVKDWRRDRAGLSWATINPDADPEEVLVRQFDAQNDLHVQKANFLKLRELSFSYRFPSQLLSEIGLRSSKITLSGRNLAIWTKYGGADPEINFHGDDTFSKVDSWTLPMVRQINLSLNVGF
jgi:TonB-linked SusC/RagA family outer membrane protein